MTAASRDRSSNGLDRRNVPALKLNAEVQETAKPRRLNQESSDNAAARLPIAAARAEEERNETARLLRRRRFSHEALDECGQHIGAGVRYRDPIHAGTRCVHDVEAPHRP